MARTKSTFFDTVLTFTDGSTKLLGRSKVRVQGLRKFTSEVGKREGQKGSFCLVLAETQDGAEDKVLARLEL